MQREANIKQEKLEAGQRRLSLIQAKQEFMETINTQIQEAEAELKQALEIVQRAKDKRASLIMQQISERADFDRQIGECEDFLRKNADPHILEEIEYFQNLKDGLPSKLNDWRQGPLIDNGWPKCFKKRPKFGSNLRGIQNEIERCDNDIENLKERILSGE